MEFDYTALSSQIEAETAHAYLLEQGAVFAGNADSPDKSTTSYIAPADVAAFPSPLEIYKAYKACGLELLNEINSNMTRTPFEYFVKKRVREDDPVFFEILETVQECSIYLSSVLHILQGLEQVGFRPQATFFPQINSLEHLIGGIKQGSITDFSLDEVAADPSKAHLNPATNAYLDALETLIFFADFQTESNTPDERLVKYLPERTQGWLKSRSSNAPEPV